MCANLFQASAADLCGKTLPHFRTARHPDWKRTEPSGRRLESKNCQPAKPAKPAKRAEINLDNVGSPSLVRSPGAALHAKSALASASTVPAQPVPNTTAPSAQIGLLDSFGVIRFSYYLPTPYSVFYKRKSRLASRCSWSQGLGSRIFPFGLLSFSLSLEVSQWHFF
jgi:hypothetical protein